jgi:hypothetical protein
MPGKKRNVHWRMSYDSIGRDDVDSRQQQLQQLIYSLWHFTKRQYHIDYQRQQIDGAVKVHVPDDTSLFLNSQRV